MDIEPIHTGWISTNQPLILPCDNIETVEQKSIKIDSELDGAMLVRINLKTPQIHLICNSEEEWDRVYNYFNRNANVIKLTRANS